MAAIYTHRDAFRYSFQTCFRDGDNEDDSFDAPSVEAAKFAADEYVQAWIAEAGLDILKG